MKVGKQYVLYEVDRNIVEANFRSWLTDDCTRFFLNRLISMQQGAELKSHGSSLNVVGDALTYIIKKTLKEGEVKAIEQILKLPEIMVIELQRKKGVR